MWPKLAQNWPPSLQQQRIFQTPKMATPKKIHPLRLFSGRREPPLLVLIKEGVAKLIPKVVVAVS